MSDENYLHQLVTPKQIVGLFEHDVCYNIPIFQRPFQWSSTNENSPVQVLWSDIEKCVESNMDHYLGAIIILPENKSLGVTDFMLIDGQQRLTALSILFRAFYDFLEDEEDDKCKTDCNKFIYNSLGKLKITRNDDNYRNYDKLMKDCEVPYTGKFFRSESCYQFFRSKLIELEETEGYSVIKDYYNATKYKLKVVTINVDGSEDPSFIFESLNNSGIRLSPVSMIRNYLMLTCASAIDTDSTKMLQNTVYTDVWEKLEQEFGGEEAVIGDFLRVYFMKSGDVVPRSNLYEYAKKIIKDAVGNTRNSELIKNRISNLFEVIKKSVNNYKYIVGSLDYPAGTQKSKIKINHSLKMIQACGFKSHRSYLLKLMDYYDNPDKEEKMGISELQTMISIIEAYVVRRTLYQNMLNNTVDKMFLRLCSQNAMSKEELYHELNTMRDAGIWPDDYMMTESFKRNDFYDENRRNLCINVFRRIDMYKLKNEEELKEFDTDTIEHIYPQNPNDDVKKKYNAKELILMDGYTNKIGNLALLSNAANSEANNKIFSEKKESYRSSAYATTRELTQYHSGRWDEVRYKDRFNKIADLILKKWPRQWKISKPSNKEGEHKNV